MAKDYYKILGVSKDASADDIKKAYKNLAKKYHPDVSKESDAGEKFKDVNEAAAVLGNTDKRKRYDEYGTADPGLDQNFSGFDFREFSQGFDFDDIFDNFFSGFGGGSRGRNRRSRGRDLLYEESITLEDAATGTSKKIHLKGVGACEDCNGTGADGGEFMTCPSCDGSGRNIRSQRTPFGVFQMQTTCGTCQGHGQKPKSTCRSCKGDGKSRKDNVVEIKIPSGAYTGLRLRVEGAGESGDRGGDPGDLYVQITVQEHSTFERHNDDLVIERSISFTTAILGGELDVPTLDGTKTLKIPQGTQPGTILKLRGAGMPSIRGGVGDLLVKLSVEIPKKVNKKQEELLRDFDSASRKKGWFG
ncbi:molecular chaperone DnaJ [Candidatus Woesearchaeota archaeon]|nr:molecular chaperone DnaJ [Candidatus Woesearchaeota archaeon]